MGTDQTAQFRNGFWGWDDYNDTLIFISKEAKDIRHSRQSTSKFSFAVADNSDVIRFKEAIDNLEQAHYRKDCQRRVKINDPEVVTVQDIKDVAIFSINPDDLCPEYIDYLHTATMDRFLRALIVYFQYFIQVYEIMLNRRAETARTLRNAAVIRNEAILSGNFSDIRSVVSKEYAAILMGTGENKKFHHMNTKNNTSLSGKDKRKFEFMIVVAGRVVWIALDRKYLSLIDSELNRLLRSDFFNIVERKSHSGGIQMLPEEKKIVFGHFCFPERKLLQRSPAIQELIFNHQDIQLMTISVLDTGISDERHDYLEAAISAPEEQLFEMGIGIGILGWPRKVLDPMLKLIPKSQTVSQANLISVSSLPLFSLPPKEEPEGGHKISRYLPKTQCKYPETPQTKKDRMTQQNMWKKFLKEFHTKLSKY